MTNDEKDAEEPMIERSQPFKQRCAFLPPVIRFLSSFVIRHSSFVFFSTLLLACVNAAEPDIVLADFEGTNYGSWKATGAAFGDAPARGTLANQQKVSGYSG